MVIAVSSQGFLNESVQAGTYDLSEWVLLDLRIGDAFRKIGDAEQADALLNRITDTAKVNDWLVPELFNPDLAGGIYTGVIPMVGYGAVRGK